MVNDLHLEHEGSTFLPHIRMMSNDKHLNILHQRVQ